MTEEIVARLQVERFAYTDPHVDEHLHAISAKVAELAKMGFRGDPTLDLNRKRRSAIDRRSPATSALIAHVPAASGWLDLVPTAAALEPLYRPHDDFLPNGIPIDPHSRQWFCNLADARGIRSRAAALKSLLAMADTPKTRWISLACGAARPVLEAAATETGATPSEVVLLDLDRAALAQASQTATQLGLQSVHPIRANVLNRKGIHHWRHARTLQESSFGVVEAVGLLEYLQDDDWPYTYRGVIATRRLMAGAVTFLRNAFKLLESGGYLVVGNMLDSHPELAFTLNVVQWPHIQPRSVDATLRLLDLACAHGDLTVIQPDDGVYALYVVRKP